MFCFFPFLITVEEIDEKETTSALITNTEQSGKFVFNNKRRKVMIAIEKTNLHKRQKDSKINNYRSSYGRQR